MFIMASIAPNSNINNLVTRMGQLTLKNPEVAVMRLHGCRGDLLTAEEKKYIKTYLDIIQVTADGEKCTSSWNDEHPLSIMDQVAREFHRTLWAKGELGDGAREMATGMLNRSWGDKGRDYSNDIQLFNFEHNWIFSGLPKGREKITVQTTKDITSQDATKFFRHETFTLLDLALKVATGGIYEGSLGLEGNMEVDKPKGTPYRAKLIIIACQSDGRGGSHCVRPRRKVVDDWTRQGGSVDNSYKGMTEAEIMRKLVHSLRKKEEQRKQQELDDARRKREAKKILDKKDDRDEATEQEILDMKRFFLIIKEACTIHNPEMIEISKKHRDSLLGMMMNIPADMRQELVQLDDKMLHGVVREAERILSLGPFDDKSWAKWLEYLNNTFIQEDARKKDAKLRKEDEEKRKGIWREKKGGRRKKRTRRKGRKRKSRRKNKTKRNKTKRKRKRRRRRK